MILKSLDGLARVWGSYGDDPRYTNMYTYERRTGGDLGNGAPAEGSEAPSGE